MCSHNRVMSMKIRQDKNSYKEIKKTSTYFVLLTIFPVDQHHLPPLQH